MSWFKAYIQSTIGAKQVMAVMGLFWALFLLGHLVGNLAIFSAQAFNEYAHLLTKNKAFLYSAEAVLIATIGLHVALAVRLKMLNKSARPSRYAVNTQKGDRAFPSFNMFITGSVVIIFLVIHLITFKFGAYYSISYDGGPEIRDIHRLVLEEFSKPLYSIWYVLSMGVLAAHLGHGVGSAFQTFGFNHPRYHTLVKSVSVGYAVVVSGGFALITIYGYLKGASII